MMRIRCASFDEAHSGALDLARTLDVDAVVSVDHDPRDGVIGEQRLERRSRGCRRSAGGRAGALVAGQGFRRVSAPL